LNKDALNPGAIDSIRPIVIMGVLIKVVEFPLLKILKRVKLNIGQIGFKERLGTEVNIARLRQKLHSLQYDNYDRKKKLPKRYLLFVDLKTAFDSVDLDLLIIKLQKKGVPIPVINTLIRLMNSSRISIDLLRTILINAGVAQGKLCSPNLFNIYIDDLLDDLNLICFCILAYADDTVFMCESKEHLLKAIEILEKWCVDNRIGVNKKKSGIIIINDDGSDSNNIRGYPVVLEYKYLGVLIDTKLSPRHHICSVRDKVSAYLKRNFMLHKQYFTPLSLIRIVDYFVKSRIAYGLCCFLDNTSMMNKLDNLLMKHLRGIFGLPANTSAQKLRATIGEPKIACRLAVRLLKNWHKYKMHFGEYPLMYEKALRKYFSESELYPKEGTSLDFYQIKFRLLNGDLKEISKSSLGLEIRNDHREFLKQKVFNYPDLRNFHVIRYFTGTTKGTCSRLFPACGCGANSTPDHGANDCPRTLKNRDEVKKKFDSLFVSLGLVEKDNVYDYLRETFFCLEKIPSKLAKKLIELMKSTILQIIVNDSSVDSRLVGQVLIPSEPVKSDDIEETEKNVIDEKDEEEKDTVLDESSTMVDDD